MVFPGRAGQSTRSGCTVLYCTELSNQMIRVLLLASVCPLSLWFPLVLSLVGGTPCQLPPHIDLILYNEEQVDDRNPEVQENLLNARTLSV